MAELKHQFYSVEAGFGDTGEVDHAVGNADDANVLDLQYSSPWPWVFAGVTSLAIWMSLGRLAWLYLR
jgi:hypothetical protein